mmetsp:Transcript_111955/g.327381  ORF Transcript_111955/g.327381 Transcript_111955/m.327381 type:complete len:507 (-) Transcript_111955:203-1723(-)
MGPPMGPPMGPMGPMMPPMGPPMGPMGMPGGGRSGEDARVHVGSVVAFDPAKGFGFIASDGFGEDVFFLRSELPGELREAQSKDEVMGQRVEFEARSMQDGKVRAKRIALVSAPRRRERRREGRKASDGRRLTHGKILRYDKAKGYGFIAANVGDNVFFLRSCLPKDMQEHDIEKLRGLEVSFELYENEDGKPRAKRLEIVGKDRGGGQPSSRQEEEEAEPITGPVHSGVIVRFDPGKGYGFVKSEEVDEDIFFFRSELPLELSSRQRREEVENQEVEFEVRTMPDGKLRAQRMELLGEPPPANEPSDEEAPQEPSLPPLDEALLGDMAEFLLQNGGGCDYGRFSSHFPKVKKPQLEGHFHIVALDRGVQRIELPEDHPARLGEPAEEPEAEEPEGEEEAEDGVPPDEPAIPLGPGCQPCGFIRGYDAAKGYGFIRCEGMDEDVFFPRAALPESFHCRRKSELPELVGVQVAFELNPSSDRGPRAERMTLLLQWHTADKCWLLKRN